MNKVHLEQIDSNDLPDEFLGKTIESLDIRKRFGANIIGFKNGDGSFEFNPPANATLFTNTKMFVLGDHDQIAEMKASWSL